MQTFSFTPRQLKEAVVENPLGVYPGVAMCSNWQQGSCRAASVGTHFCSSSAVQEGNQTWQDKPLYGWACNWHEEVVFEGDLLEAC